MKLVLVINVFTAFVVFAVGVLFLAGVIPTPAKDTTTRYLFGFILMGYGVYRFVNFNTKRKMLKFEEKREKIKEAQEKLIHGENEISKF